MHTLSIPDSKKLLVTYRVEPGCLGPNGANVVIGFCRFVQEEIRSLDENFVSWNILPRDDKKLPEMEYQILGKKMSHTQAEKYLERFGKSLDEFETALISKLAELIDQYMKH